MSQNTFTPTFTPFHPQPGVEVRGVGAKEGGLSPLSPPFHLQALGVKVFADYKAFFIKIYIYPLTHPPMPAQPRIRAREAVFAREGVPRGERGESPHRSIAPRFTIRTPVP